MKTSIALAAVLAAAVSFSCATRSGTGAAPDARSFDTTEASFADAQGKTWNLYSVTRGTATEFIDRKALESDGFTGIYSLTFGGPPVNNPAQPSRILGKGAPNNFVAAYKLGEGQSISVEGTPASTMMAPIKEPKQLKEHDFFTFVSRVSAWKIAGGKLMLLTSDSAGAEVVLTFIAP